QFYVILYALEPEPMRVVIYRNGYDGSFVASVRIKANAANTDAIVLPPLIDQGKIDFTLPLVERFFDRFDPCGISFVVFELVYNFASGFVGVPIDDNNILIELFLWYGNQRFTP